MASAVAPFRLFRLLRLFLLILFLPVDPSFPVLPLPAPTARGAEVIVELLTESLILCGVAYTKNRVGSRFNRVAGAWLRKHAALYPEALERFYLHEENTLVGFYNTWMECLREFRP